ncbi:MAG: Ig-like domain-containing protein [Eubacteriales bacterium]
MTASTSAAARWAVGGTWTVIKGISRLFCRSVPDLRRNNLYRGPAEALKDLPIYYIHSVDDPTVNISGGIAAYNALKDAGNDRVYLALYEHVWFEGLPEDELGPGHWSWVYVHNDFDGEGEDEEYWLDEFTLDGVVYESTKPIELGFSSFKAWLAAQEKRASEIKYDTYKFEITDLDEVYPVTQGVTDPDEAGFEAMIPVKIRIVVDKSNDNPYKGMVRVAAVGVEGLQLWAKDTEGDWYDINKVGWGPPGGFPIDSEAITEVYVVATEELERLVTLELVDITGNYGAEDGVIISQDVAIKAFVEEPAEPIKGSFESTGNVGIAPDTAGDAAGKIYAEYGLVVDGESISLADSNVEYIKVKVGEGDWEELTPNTDDTLWFNVEKAKGSYEFEVKANDGTIYLATLDWQAEINEATWEATGREGPHDGKTYVEYKLMDGSEQVSLEVGKVKLIATKDGEKWVALEPNTDENLWFNKAHGTGSYDFFIVTAQGAMYRASLDWLEKILAEADYNAAWNEERGTWYIKVTVPGENLDADSIQTIYVVKQADEKLDEPRALTPDSDKVLWFGVAKGNGDLAFRDAGEYAYEVVRKDGSKYMFSFTYDPDKVQGVEEVRTLGKLEGATDYPGYDNWSAAITEDGIDFSRITKEQAIAMGLPDADYYGIAMKLVVGNDPIDLNSDNVLKVVRSFEDGEPVDVLVTADGTVQFVHDGWGEAGKYTMCYYLIDGRVIEVEINVISFEFSNEARWNAVGVGVNTIEGKDYIFQGFELLDAEGNQIPLVADNIETMTVLGPGDTGPRELTVGDDSDPLLWFNVLKAAGEYRYTVVTKEGLTYFATLNWTEPREVAATPGGVPQYNETLRATYQKYNVEDISLLEFDAMYQIKPSGAISELVPSGDDCLWFKVDSDDLNWFQEEGEHIFLVKHGDAWSTFVISYTMLIDTTWYNVIDKTFTITNASQLAGLAKLVNRGVDFRGKTIALGADIDLSGYDWVPIGFINETTEIWDADEYDRCPNVFRGSFDGRNHTISNLRVNKAEYKAVGLFGVISLTEDAEIKDIKFTNATVNGYTGVGVLTGMVRAGTKWVNGIGHAAQISGIEVVNSSVTGLKYVGGIIGYSTASVKDSLATNVIVTANYKTGMAGKSGETAGGIVGNLYDLFSITNCTVTDSNIISQTRAGGIAGSSRHSNGISGCYVNGVRIELIESTDEDAENEGYAGYISGRAEQDVIDLSSNNEVDNCTALIFGAETDISDFCTPVKSVSVDPKNISLFVGDTDTLSAIVAPDNVSNKMVVWTSSNPNVATVSADGVVTAVAEGEATITATSKADRDKKDSCVVNVTKRDIQIVGNGFVNSTSIYRGVFVEVRLPGNENEEIQSLKIELYNDQGGLIGTNILNDVTKAYGNGLTSPFVVIPGDYTSSSWTTVWEEGEPSPNNAPAFALITATDANGVPYTAQQNYSGDWRTVWALDIHLSTTSSFYVQDSASYKGVTTEFSYSGADLDKIVSLKIELFDKDGVLIGVNTLKSEKLKINGGELPSEGALTSPFVVIPGDYVSGSWNTDWNDSNLRPDNAPVKAVATAIDINGVAYTAEDNDFNSFSGNGGSWASIWDAIVVSNNAELMDALQSTEFNLIILEDGEYGTVIIQNLTRPVTLVAKSLHRASFAGIEIKSNDVTIDSVTAGYIDFYNASNITVTNNVVTGNRFTVAIGAAGGGNNGPTVIKNNIVLDGAIGLMPTEDFEDYTITGNTIVKASDEGIWLWYTGPYADKIDSDLATGIAEQLASSNNFGELFGVGKYKVKVQFGTDSDKIFR